MSNRFLMCIPLPGILPSVRQVLHCPPGIASAHEMLGQFRSQFSSLFTIPQLQSRPNLPMPACPSTQRYTLIMVQSTTTQRAMIVCTTSVHCRPLPARDHTPLRLWAVCTRLHAQILL